MAKKKKKSHVRRTMKKGRKGGMATFIRACGVKPAKEVVALGAKQGFNIPLQYVYAVRAYNQKPTLFPSVAKIRRDDTLEALLARHAREIKEFILRKL
jgi:hypothetical protein